MFFKYRMKRTSFCFKILLVISTVFVVCFLIFGPKNEALNFKSKLHNIASSAYYPRNKKLEEAIAEWKKCFAEKLNGSRTDPEKMWNSTDFAVNRCRNQTAFSSIPLTAIRNKDETKYHLFGTSKEPFVTVTLGVGLDVIVEETLKKNLPNGSKFYGADPIFEGNGKLFKPIGSYFPFAVGKEMGVGSASVLENGEYMDQTMSHIDIITFFRKFVNQSFVDQFLMDNEGPEYDILPMMAREKEFDQNGLVICQCNTEVHEHGQVGKRKFLDIMNTIIDDGRYAVLVSNICYHQRIYFINVENSLCVERYLARFFAK